MLCSVVVVSGCVSDNKQTNETKTYSQNNISFDYPGAWEIANTTSPNAVVAVADPKTVQNGTPTTLVVIQKPDITQGSDLNSVYDANYATFFNKTVYQRVSEGNITVSGSNALENIYKTNTTDDQRQYRAVWLSSNNNIYVILCVAKQTDFEAQQANFNLIVNSFKSQ
jgi:predicted Zn-dependent protease